MNPDNIEMMLFALFFLVLLGLIYRWAENWGRSGPLAVVISAFLSPLIPVIYLLFLGKKKTND